MRAFQTSQSLMRHSFSHPANCAPLFLRRQQTCLNAEGKQRMANTSAGSDSGMHGRWIKGMEEN